MYLFLNRESPVKAINLDHVTSITFNDAGNVTFYFGNADSFTAYKTSHQEIKEALERYDTTRFGYVL